MPVLTPYAPDTFVGDGVSTTFPITFDFQFFSDLALTTTVVATGVVTPLVYGTSYSVSPQTNSPASTGSVTLFAALPVGTNLTVSRAVPITQDTTWIPNDPNPSTSTQNAVDKLTLIAQDLEYQVLTLPTGGGANVVTTAIFAMAAIGSPNTIVVSSVDEFSVGNTIQVSNSALTLVAQITAINPATLTLTATTLAIVAGTPGTNMPVGAAVQLGAVPANNTILVGDAVNPPQAVSKIEGVGDPTAVNSFGTQVDLYVASYAGNAATVRGILNYVQGKNITATNNLTAAPHPAVLAVQQTDGFMSYLQSTTTGGVLRYLTSSTIGFSLLDATNVTPGSLTPALLQATNSPTDTFVPTYNAATQKFTWAAGGSGAVPGGGNSSQFLRGDVGWSNQLLGSFTCGSADGQNYIITSVTPAGTSHTMITSGISDLRSWISYLNPLLVGSISLIDTAGGSSTFPAEGMAVQNIIRATASMRALNGYQTKMVTVNAPATSITVDIATSAYQRFTGFANNVTITALADTRATPTTDVYGSELTMEINAPGAFTITWPATVTWVGGASAPTLNTTGINLVKLVRRQGQTQWVGYTETQSSATTYTDAQARSAVLSSTYLLPSATVNWAISAGVSAAPGIIAGSITGTYLAPGAISSSGFFGVGVIPNTAIAAGTISTSKLNLPGGTAVYMDGTGNFTTPAGGGSGGVNVNNLGIPLSGGPFTTLNLTSNLTATNAGAGTVNIAAAGGGGSFSPATPYVWTATQNFAVPQVFNANPTGPWAGSTGAVYVNGAYPSTLPGDTTQNGSGIYVEIANAGSSTGVGNGINSATFRHVVTGSQQGINSLYNILEVRKAVSSGSFGICTTSFVQTEQLAGGYGDGIWLASFGPISTNGGSSGVTDNFGTVHTWSSGAIRAGEVNYGNAWTDFGYQDLRGGTRWTSGLEFFPDFLAGSISSPSSIGKFNATFGIVIGQAPSGTVTGIAKNWTGLMFDIDGIAPTGFPVNIHGGSSSGNATSAAINIQGHHKTGINFAGAGAATPTNYASTGGVAATIEAETVSGHSNTAAIIMAQGQAVCFAPPTAANTGVYIVYDGTHLKATINGGNTFTNIV